MMQQNHYNPMISFYDRHHLYYFVHISSIKEGKQLDEYLT